MTAHDSTRWDLEHALSSEGCPICHVSQKGIARFFDSLLYENANDPGIRQHMTASLGLCNRHAWQMRAAHGSSLGTALLYHDALQQWQKQLDTASEPNARASVGQMRQQIAQANAPQAKCLACERQADIERRYIAVLIESLADHAFADALRASAGLCRPYFAGVRCDERNQGAQCARRNPKRDQSALAGRTRRVHPQERLSLYGRRFRRGRRFVDSRA